MEQSTGNNARVYESREADGERADRKLQRDDANEILRGVEFESVRKEREELEKWREKYNNERPHSALNYEPPSSLRRPHGGDTNKFNLESINPIYNNINQVNLLP